MPRAPDGYGHGHASSLQGPKVTPPSWVTLGPQFGMKACAERPKASRIEQSVANFLGQVFFREKTVSQSASNHPLPTRPAHSFCRAPGESTASWEVTGVLYRGGVPFGERSEPTFLFRRAAGDKIFALEAPNKRFSFEFHVGSRSCGTLKVARNRRWSHALKAVSGAHLSTPTFGLLLPPAAATSLKLAQ